MPLRKGLDRILFLILGLVPFITLVQFDEAIYPYVTSKHFTFRILILLGGAIWFNLALIDRAYRPQWTPILKSLLAFVAVAFVADLFGANFWNSFWSNYSRMEGFISLLFFLLFFLMLSSVFRSEKRWRIYWLVQVLISIVVLVVAVLQKMRLMLAVDYNRVDSVFGNSSYLAIYASMIFFLCLYLFFSFRSKWIKGLLVLTAVCNLVSIYLSQTRSATLAVMVGVAFFAYVLAKNKKTALLSMAVGFLAFMAGVFLLKSRSGVSTNLFERIAQISLQDASTQARIEIWAYCWRAFLDQPFLGWGQENFEYLAPFFRAQLWSTPWVDRSHNIFLEWMVNAGSVGLIAISVLLFVTLKGIWKVDSAKLNRPQVVALLCVFFCWLINQFLSIDFFSISILFYSLLAYIHVLHIKEERQLDDEKASKSLSGLAKAGLTGVFIFLGLWVNNKINVNGLLKNIEFRQFTKPQVVTDHYVRGIYKTENPKIFQGNFSYETRELRLFLIQNAFFVLNQFRAQQVFSEEYPKYYYQVTHEMVQQQMKADPKALFFKHMAANFYTQYFQFQIAEPLFQELIGKVPQQQLFWVDYGHMRLAQGRLAEGLQLYKKAYDFEPKNPASKMYLALGYIYNKRFTEGNELTNQLMAENRPDVFDERLINAYQATDQKAKVEEIIAFKKKFYKGNPK